MKKSTLLISSLVLSTVLLFGQANRKAAPITNATHLNAIDEQTNQDMIQNAKKSPSGHIRCFTTEVNQMKKMTDPSVKTPEEFESWISQIMKANQNNPSTQKASRNIPVVVHVLHNGDAVGSNENISLAQINSQITVLNADFSATNADYANTPAAFNTVKGNLDIQFCLAQTDPNGQPTTGINRVNTGVASYTTGTIEAAKPATQWDPTKYFNIWVCNLGGGILGYAQFPNSGAANTDGVVITYWAFGSTGTVSAPYNKGRTTTHEIGHCLGLYHIWGDDGTACTGSDQVADTPNQADENYGCPNFATNISCGNAGDMAMNYMDYTDDQCMYMFTNGQKARVDAVLASAPRRASLLTSTVCNTAAITANFTASSTVINETQSVTFTDASSSPATLNSWLWTFTGGSPASSNVQTPPAITYNTAGTYTVTLTVGDNAAGNDTETKTAYITVNAAGTVICDSTAAGWDWYTEAFGGAYWSADLCVGHDGYIMGNNCYDDNGWASIVPYPGAGKELTDVIYLFVQSSGTGVATLKVWNGNGPGKNAANGNITTAPGTIIEQLPTTSGAFSASLNSLLTLPLTTPFPLTAPVYIGYDHPAAPASGDTLCMGVANGTSGNTTWANESGIGWRDIAYWGVDYKGTVAAVICDAATGVSTHTLETSEVNVYPNPSTGMVSVMMPTNTKNFEVIVYNVVGEQITNKNVNSNFDKVDLSNQPNGVYFVKVTSNGEVTTKKVLLSK